ncbi:amino acid permease [Candidatus Woesearchaeota archaeon]|nr:amino acid permease [Candidatus Woesearchaeota archaeon]
MAELEKTLSFPVILIITINSIMGTGIFFLPALGAKIAGNASIISWGLMALVAMGIGLVFAELVGMFPKAGGVYEYSKQAFGHFPSFLIGWMTMIAGNVTIAMLVVGAVRYLNPGLPEPLKILISIVFILAFNFMAYKGMQTSAVMLVAFGLITLTTLFSLIIPGFLAFNPANLDTITPLNFSLIFLAVFFIAETFFGWETATFLAEETKNAKKVMPRAMWIGTLLIGLIVMAFVITSLSSIPWKEFGASLTPLADLANLHYGSQGVTVMSMLVYLSIIGSVAGWIVSAPRLIMSLAEDKLFITQFADIHPVYKTPYKAIVFQTILTSILVVIGSGNYETLLHLLLPIVLILYAVVILAFLVLRWKQAETERPFKFRGGVPISFLLIGCILALLIMWITLDHSAIDTLQLAGGFLFFGVPVFLLLSFYYNPSAIIGMTEFFAYGNLLLERFLLPKRIRREMLSLFKRLEKQHVLEYGSGVGTLTLHLAERVGPEGKVTATDISARNIRILERRLKRRHITHVRTLHDPHQINRVHPEIKEVDIVFSVGMLSYIQDMQKVLKDVHKVLPEHGRVCFVEYVDYFRFLPNPKWLDDENTLKELFAEAGFSVQVTKLHGIFWNYLFVYGVKSRHATKGVPYI